MQDAKNLTAWRNIAYAAAGIGILGLVICADRTPEPFRYQNGHQHYATPWVGYELREGDRLIGLAGRCAEGPWRETLVDDIRRHNGIRNEDVAALPVGLPLLVPYCATNATQESGK